MTENLLSNFITVILHKKILIVILCIGSSPSTLWHVLKLQVYLTFKSLYEHDIGHLLALEQRLIRGDPVVCSFQLGSLWLGVIPQCPTGVIGPH